MWKWPGSGSGRAELGLHLDADTAQERAREYAAGIDDHRVVAQPQSMVCMQQLHVPCLDLGNLGLRDNLQLAGLGCSLYALAILLLGAGERGAQGLASPGLGASPRCNGGCRLISGSTV